MILYILYYTHMYFISLREIYRYIHTMEYYSAMRKNEILPSVTTWMVLEGNL